MTTPLNQLESLGRYTLLRELGRGGMSVVYLAKDTELGREVAIKCVDTSAPSAAKLAERLRSEAKLLAQLNHPNIVQLYDVVEQENILGLVIEFVGGDTLTQRLKQDPSKEVKLKWLAEVADGLSSAHQKGIAHCDLKADNVLITHDNIAKVADFGIAKVKLNDYLEDDGLTRVDNVSGSYFSLSPEQATGQPVDTRTDLFSLAILTYQSLIGEHPYGDTHNKIALLQRIISEPAQISPKSALILGPRLGQVLIALLNKNPSKRLYNAAQVEEILRNNTQSSSPSEDETQEIPINAHEQKGEATSIQTETKRSTFKKSWLPLLMLATGFAVGALTLDLSSKPETSLDSVTYIALDEIKVSSTEDSPQKQNALYKTSIKHSAENALLALTNVGLVTASDLNSATGSLAQKALAAGVDKVLRVSLDCGKNSCDITLEERQGPKMAVSKRTNFISPFSLTLSEVENQITSKSIELLGGKLTDQASVAISDKDYQRYLSVYKDSKAGTASTIQQHQAITTFIRKYPSYEPAYLLAFRIANHLNLTSGNGGPLSELEELVNSAPKTLESRVSIKIILCNIAIVTGDISQAESRLDEIRTTDADIVEISQLESALAYAKNDFDSLLELDRKNVLLRPSALNHYNLATSEFFVGNLDSANEQLDAALALLPSYAYARDLKASIAMSQGKLTDAENIYKSLINESDGGNYYVNYALTLMLKGEATSAVTMLEKAIELNPKSTIARLTLADALSLSNQKRVAKKYYLEVISSIKSPTTPQDYSYLAQAQAHTGELTAAVRTLKIANGAYPDIAELDYASAIVNTLAGNYISATVDVKDSIEQGTSPIFYTFNWFKPLCSNKDFVDSTSPITSELCSVN